MYACDFEYDGKLLSDFGFMVCSFDGKSGVETADSGSEITFATSPVHSGKRYIANGAGYENCLSTTFQICKNPDYFRPDETEITTAEFRALSRWLNRREFLWFRAFDMCEPEKQRPWVRASFTLSRIEVGGTTYGVELDMQTDSPFGYGDLEEVTLAFTSGALSKKLIDLNDEIGETYPETVITCGSAGTIMLTDDITGCSSSIDNCASGEVITMSGDTMIISTSNVAHNLANDFNYDFFRFGNTYDNRENTITANRACTVVIRYRPIWKDTL